MTGITHWRWRLAATFLLFLIVYSVFVQRTGTNQLSRLDLTFSMSYEGRLQIDHFGANSIDKAYEGHHYYSDKAPGVSFLALPWYQFFRHWFRLDQVNIDTQFMLDFITWLINSVLNVPFSALLVIFMLLIGFQMQPRGDRFWQVAFIFGLGTLSWPYATLLFGHNIASFFSFAAFALAFAVVRLQKNASWLLLLSGVSAGMGVLVEYPNGIIAIALLVYLWFTLRDRRQILWFIAGGLAMALLLAAYNTATFGAPWRISYLYHSAPWGEHHREGVLGVTWPRWVHIHQLLFSPKGLFYLMPVTLLAPVAYWQMSRQRRWRAEFYLFLALPLLFLGLNSAYFYTMGGSSPGPRFLLVSFPYLFLPYVFLSGRWRWPLWLLGGVSGIIQFAIVAGNPLVGRFANPLLEYWLPRLLVKHEGMPILFRLRYGLPYTISLLLLFLLVILGIIVWLWPVVKSLAGKSLLVTVTALFLVVYLLASGPVNLRHPRQIPPSFLQASPPIRDGGPLLPTDPF